MRRKKKLVDKHWPTGRKADPHCRLEQLAISSPGAPCMAHAPHPAKLSAKTLARLHWPDNTGVVPCCSLPLNHAGIHVAGTSTDWTVHRVVGSGKIFARWGDPDAKTTLPSFQCRRWFCTGCAN